MSTAELLTRARHVARLSQSELANRAHTSRPTLSAYEHGRTSPTMETPARLLAAAGQELTAVPQVKFAERALSHSRTTLVPTFLPRLPVRQAMATITLSLHLNWSQPQPAVQALRPAITAIAAHLQRGNVGLAIDRGCQVRNQLVVVAHRGRDQLPD